MFNFDWVPGGLVLLRFLIAPLLLWDALDGETSSWFLFGFGVAFLSDILDGIIARRLNVSSARLRQADSWADVCLFGCVAVSAWLTRRSLILQAWVPLTGLAIAQLLWWIVNLTKYGKPASYHTYSAKLWGLTLLVAIVALFGWNSAGLPLWISCLVGIVHSIEEIAMTLVLPHWQHDVLSLVHALRLRRELQEVSPD